MAETSDTLLYITPVTLSKYPPVLCDVSQGVMVSDEDLRKTFLQPEEPQQQGEDPVDDFRHPDLLGTDIHSCSQTRELDLKGDQWKTCTNLILHK